jgi:Papain-like cysteine protease AvrRpt2
MPQKLNKKDVYMSFDFKWPEEKDVDSKSSLVIEEAGEIEDKTVHMTVFRLTWMYRFQPYHGVDEIFDRIFGSGTGGLHATLEDTNPDGSECNIHCYIGGPNQGRTAEERTALQKVLDDHVAKIKRALDRLIRMSDSFIFEDADDPDKPFDFLAVDAHKDCFDRIAAIASARHGLKVVYPAQGDLALLWSTGSVHPLQPLQNSYQRMVRDAVRGLESEAAKDKESSEMTKYFYFTANPPKLMGLAPDAPPDVATQLEDLERTLAALEREIPTLTPAACGDHLTKVVDGLWKIRTLFNAKDTLEEKKKARWVPGLAAAEKNLKGFKKALDKAKISAKAAEELEAIRNRLVHAQRDLVMAHGGMCSIQNFHTIEPFYLFRLLVKFQIQSKTKIPAADRTKVSSSLTGLLHNSKDVKWLFDWLRQKLVDLNKLLKETCPDGPKTKEWPKGEPAVVFFLKGGRAAKTLLGKELEGENDWDTNIVINPTLKAGEWYKTFLLVHNAVVGFLEKAKRELNVLVYQNAPYSGLVKGIDAFDKEDKKKRAESREKAVETLEDGFMARLFDADMSDADKKVLDDAEKQIAALEKADQLRKHLAGSKLEEMETENCKAELIDIGIPRRDTVEAFEQWYHVCPRIILREELPIPGHLYYIGEYVTMIREAFMDKCISTPKTPKRVVRLLEVLKMQSEEFTTLIAEEKKHIPSTLAESVSDVDALNKPPLQRMLTILLKQFAEAYHLAEDPDLAKCFNAAFKKELPDRAAKAKYPASLTQAIADEKGYGTDAANKELADAIGFAQWIAEDFGKHLTNERATFMHEEAAWFVHFIKAIYTASFFAAGEDLEVVFAVSGAFAAYLHGRYARFERMEELEPVTRIDLKIYCKSGSDPATVLELIQPCIDEYLKVTTDKRPHYHVVKGAAGTIYLQWPEKKTFKSGIEYKPIVMKITAEPVVADWPQLSFIKGLPVLGLRDLIWEYKRNTGHVEETFTQRNLKAAIDAMIDILTRFENPSPGDAWELKVAQAPLLGAPPPDPPDAPDDVVIVKREVARLTFIPQKKANWCWAAASLMMRKFYLNDQAAIEDVVREQFPNLEDEQNALRLSRLKPEGKVEGRLLTWDAIKTLIDADKPFIIARDGHYWVCYGYEEGGSRKSLLYWDPLPKETGKKKRMTYAEYEARIRGGGATAQDFAIEPRRVLLPLEIHDDTFEDDASSMFFTATTGRLSITSAELRIRHQKNSLGEIGAVVRRISIQRPAAKIEWDMKVPATAWPVDKTRMPVYVELEATLPNDETRVVPEGATRIAAVIEKPLS